MGNFVEVKTPVGGDDPEGEGEVFELIVNMGETRRFPFVHHLPHFLIFSLESVSVYWQYPQQHHFHLMPSW